MLPVVGDGSVSQALVECIALRSYITLRVHVFELPLGVYGWLPFALRVE